MYSSRSTRSTVCAVATAALLAACADSPTDPATSMVASRSGGAMIGGVPLPRAVVVFRDTAAIPLQGLALIQSLGGTVARSHPEIGVAFVDGLSAVGLLQLRASDLVQSAGFDRYLNWIPAVRAVAPVDAGSAIRAAGNPWEASYFADGRQWGPRVIEADVAWKAGFVGSPSVRVGILDTGIDYDNRELAGLVDHAASASFTSLFAEAAGSVVDVGQDVQLAGDQPYMDNHFHGTHVASTVASNAISVAGVAPRTTLVAVKVLNMLGSGTFEGVAAGILHAAGPANVDVINMSLGAEVDVNEDGVPALLELMRRTIRQAEKLGTIVISAAGNSGLNLDIGSLVATPCEQSTICVSATGPLLQQGFDQPATYTNFGITAVDVAAPGGNAHPTDDSQYQTEDLIIGACSRRTSEAGLAPCRASTEGVAYFYAWAAGTSMATPHTAGLAALIKSAHPSLSVKGLEKRILNSADDVGVPGRDVYTNWGRINARKAVQ